MTALETQLIATLDEIARIAMACRSDMQGRLEDSVHMRAYAVLGGIATRATVPIQNYV
jgi:hypothetical protein